MLNFFETIKKSIQNLLGDKLRIISLSFGLIPWIKDWEDVIQGYISYMKEIYISFGVLLLGLISHYYFERKRLKVSESNDDIHSANHFNKNYNKDDIINQVNESPVNYSYVNDKKQNIFFWRLLTILFLSFLVFSLSTFIYIKNATIYYVKIGYYSTENQSNKKAEKINKIFEKYPQYKLRAMTKRRSSNERELNYLLCINGGFISLNEAKEIKKIANEIIPKGNASIGGSSKISLIRKIQYLSSHVKRKVTKPNKY